MTFNTISLNPFKIAFILCLVAFLLVLASTAVQLTAYMSGDDHLHGLFKLFYLDEEQNFLNFFSTFLLLFVSLLLSIITVLERDRNPPQVLHWTILTIGFVCMAADDFIALHERLTKPIHKLLGNGNLGIFYFSWVIPGIALVLILSLFFMRFWWRLPARTRLTFFLAGVIYIGGCIGFDLLGGRYAELYGYKSLIYSVLTTIEETLEMAGLILFIWGLLEYIAVNHKEVQFRFDGSYGEVTFEAPPEI